MSKIAGFDSYVVGPTTIVSGFQWPFSLAVASWSGDLNSRHTKQAGSEKRESLFIAPNNELSIKHLYKSWSPQSQSSIFGLEIKYIKMVVEMQTKVYSLLSEC